MVSAGVSSSCKTALHHTAPKQLKIFFETRDNTPDFISSREWTPHSPDLNPLDYSVWNILQELVYEGRREYMLFCWFISPTSLHNDMQKFGTFFSGHPVYTDHCRIWRGRGCHAKFDPDRWGGAHEFIKFQTFVKVAVFRLDFSPSIISEYF